MLSWWMESYHCWLWQNPTTQRCNRMQLGLCCISHSQVGQFPLHCCRWCSWSLQHGHFPSFSSLLHKYLMSSRSHSCAGTSAAVLGFRSAVLQLQCSVQHCCHPGASPEAAQLGGTFFVKVSSDPHVFLSAKGKHGLYCLTDELEFH